MKNIKIVKRIEGDAWFKRNAESLENQKISENNIIGLFQTTRIKFKNILEIGCSNGLKLNAYQNYLQCENCYGIDLSKKAIKDGQKKYPKLKLKQLSSLEIDKLNRKFNLIICGFFLYLLDREKLFNQFGIIFKQLDSNGYLLIEDFDPLFAHSNNSDHNQKLKSFKMNYSNFLEASCMFKLIYKYKWQTPNSLKKNFLSTDVSLSLFKKINFEMYPQNI